MSVTEIRRAWPTSPSARGGSISSKPLRVLRLVLDENEYEYGIALDVTCTSTNLPYEVTGKVDGWVEVGGDRVELSATTNSFFGNNSRDHQPGRGGPRLFGRAPRRAGNDNCSARWARGRSVTDALDRDLGAEPRSKVQPAARPQSTAVSRE